MFKSNQCVSYNAIFQLQLDCRNVTLVSVQELTSFRDQLVNIIRSISDSQITHIPQVCSSTLLLHLEREKNLPNKHSLHRHSKLIDNNKAILKHKHKRYANMTQQKYTFKCNFCRWWLKYTVSRNNMYALTHFF